MDQLATKPPIIPIPVNPAVDKFIKSQLNQTKDYPPPEALLHLIQGQNIYPFMTLKSFSLWHGKAKSKKTTALAIIIASYISKLNNVNQIKFESQIPGVVLFFDTEQGESYAARTMRLILSLAYVSVSPQLIYCDLREYSPTERIEIIKTALETTPNVKLLVIDGIVDLMNDFMDAAEGHVTVLSLLKLTSVYNIHIAGIIHQNKADKNARAHIGSIATQKCEMEVSVETDEQDKTQSVISCIRSRGLSFEDLFIRWDRGEMPHIVQEGQSGHNSEKKGFDPSDLQEWEMQPLVNEIFKITQKQRYTELITNTVLCVSKNHKKIGQSKAREFVQVFLNEGLIQGLGIQGSRNYLYELC